MITFTFVQSHLLWYTYRMYGCTHAVNACTQAWWPHSALQWRHNERDGVSYRRRLYCLRSGLFQAQIKESTKSPRHWPLCGEFTGVRWIPRPKDNNAENASIWWRHHEAWRVHSDLMALHPGLIAAFKIDGHIQAWWLYSGLMAALRLDGCTQPWWPHSGLMAVLRIDGRTYLMDALRLGCSGLMAILRLGDTSFNSFLK